MWTSGTQIRTLNLYKTLYVCPACHRHLRRQFATLLQRKNDSTTGTIRGDAARARCIPSNSARSLSLTGKLRSQAQTSQSPTTSVAPPDSIPEPPGPTYKQKPTENSVIRDHLRAWSLQNQRNQAENAEARYNSPARLSTLPQSLFIEETPYDEREPEEELDEYGGAEGAWGDLFYIRSKMVKGRPQFGVYLGMVGFQSQILLEDGRWVMEDKVNIEVCPVFRGFASEAEVQSITKHLPVKPLEMTKDGLAIKVIRHFADDVPHGAAADLKQRIEKLRDDINEFRRENLPILDTIYEQIAQDDKYVFVLYDDIFRKLFGLGQDRLPYAAQVAVFLALDKQFDTIQPVVRLRDAEAFTFLPRRLVKGNEKVCGWARQYQESAAEAALGKNVSQDLERNPLTAFVDKARRLILKSRALRSPTTTGTLGPSSIQSISNDKIATKETGIDFSEQDKVILEFLWDCYVREPWPMLKNRNHSIGSLILRAIGAYPKLRLERKIGSLLLQEMGVLAPWASSAYQHIGFQIPEARAASEVDDICAESDRVCDELGLTENPHHGLLEDSMASLRQDLGDMPVFCVDGGSTQIRDDGYSLEADNDHPGTYWIHVHVAHPSAFIGPDHIFSKRAERLGQTLYGPRYYPMFPEGFAQAMSLRAGAPSLTVSTLMTENGEVKDIKIRPTMIRNVINLEPAAVAAVLGQSQPEMAHLIVGQKAGTTIDLEKPVPEAQLEAARKHQQTFQKLHKLLLARSRARRSEIPEYASFPLTIYPASVHVDHVEQDNDPNRLFRSYHYLGDPAIKYSSLRQEKTFLISERENDDTLTGMNMVLASESAGKWVAARGIPACFQGALTQPGYPLSVLNKMAQHELKRFPLQQNSSEPLPHVYLDSTAYLRCTSPIRRCTDVLAHWQVDAYLRAEAQNLISPGMRADSIELPFTKEMMDNYIIQQEFRQRRGVLEVESTDRRTWLLRALFRAFHFKEAPLPETWDLRIQKRSETILRDGDTGLTGRLLPFDAPARLLETPEGWEKSATHASYVPVKIELVDVAQRSVFCKAVGPPSVKANFTDPICAIGYSGTQGNASS
ncbi:3'-5' RNA exonuclease complex component [Elasticomyces elasticus]|uniref:3'-5' RNA exonuclease complex component n=1 Tax=Exophiala sideris TaxID=1016849 RepID=A0ABR0IZ46_9EURO|nr:3'-5' RNA exonuclease complex component [Elasticomyces elasticus]KAK5023054.1 3'-5' RNA exonuclease complex component [Exophiala sideris]KAK5026779.1 3'-5' RNA exonuclease complex component [Exophiala sideris]KAK5052432.1 3'-5' RNA exonuclease complex component [Exophiala sideris]KAK5178217.1 3'-5' RNA exonuclease complex component [Eurotiomycetes sp. CCFEE 6388]